MPLGALAALLLLPVAAVAQEEGLIQGSRASRGLETPELHVHVRDDPTQTVAELTRYNIVGNVLREDAQSADHWFVLFCVEWYEPCQAYAAAYDQLSAEVQAERGDGAVLRAPVRFARVSCAKDKPLCNQFQVEEYPTLAHFSGGKQVGTWVPERKRPGMRAWVTKQMAEAASVPVPAAAPSAGWGPRLVANFVAVALLFGASLCHVLKELVSWRPKMMGARGAMWREVELRPAAASASPALPADAVEPDGCTPRTHAAAALPEGWELEL